MPLKEAFAAKVDSLRDSYRSLVKDHGDTQVSTVNVKQLFGGMRGARALVCDTSKVPPDKGLIIRGHPVSDMVDWLPEKAFYLLLVGEEPDEESMRRLQEDIKRRSLVPRYVFNTIDAQPWDAHPMSMLTTALNSLSNESVFRARYTDGIAKEDLWKPALEDAMNIIARLPAICAYIFRRRYDKGPRIEGDPNLDIGANFVRMLGLPDPDGELTKLMRLYIVLHSDHGGGNASAFTTYTVSSTLADPYLSLAAGLNALAGPLHGLANQECLRWAIALMDHVGGVPTEEQVTQHVNDTLAAHRVIPGYGHAVLRVEDPRFTAFLNFGRQYLPEDPVFKTVDVVYRAVPKVLSQIEKISNPWPNVDAASGALLYHYGMRDVEYYTVMFSLSRAFGVLSQSVIARATGLPIMRPGALTTEALRGQIAGE